MTYRPVYSNRDKLERLLARVQSVCTAPELNKLIALLDLSFRSMQKSILETKLPSETYDQNLYQAIAQRIHSIKTRNQQILKRILSLRGFQNTFSSDEPSRKYKSLLKGIKEKKQLIQEKIEQLRSGNQHDRHHMRQFELNVSKNQDNTKMLASLWELIETLSLEVSKLTKEFHYFQQMFPPPFS